MNDTILLILIEKAGENNVRPFAFLKCIPDHYFRLRVTKYPPTTTKRFLFLTEQEAQTKAGWAAAQNCREASSLVHRLEL